MDWIGSDQIGLDRIGSYRIGSDGLIGLDGMGWDGMGWDLSIIKCPTLFTMSGRHTYKHLNLNKYIFLSAVEALLRSNPNKRPTPSGKTT